jgi:hyperosmotically inducible periplasmic protein
MKRLMIVDGMIFLFLAGCGVTDAGIKQNVEEKLNSVPYMQNVSVIVQQGVATISGICNDTACKSNCENLARHVDGVKSVINKLTIAPVPIQASIIYQPDEMLSLGVTDAVKHLDSVDARVNNGIIVLNGPIKKRELPKLMEKLHSLTPVKIENNLTIR